MVSTKFLHNLLIPVFLISLLLMPNHMSFTETMAMDEMISEHSNMRDQSARENSSGSCCAELTSCAIGCAFLLPQYIHLSLSGGSTRVVISNPAVQTICIETATPPPKA